MAFLTKADNDDNQKLSPAQMALGQELRAARAHKAVGKQGAASTAARPQSAVPDQVAATRLAALSKEIQRDCRFIHSSRI